MKVEQYKMGCNVDESMVQEHNMEERNMEDYIGKAEEDRNTASEAPCMELVVHSMAGSNY